MTGRHLAAALVLPALLGASRADAADHRTLTLADGRVIHAEILATEATGLRVAVPQGRMTLPFSQLTDMTFLEEAAYRAQDPWWVLVVAGSAHRDALLEATARVPGLAVLGADHPPQALPSDALDRLSACDDDLGCIGRVTAPLGAVWVVGIRGDELTARVTTGPTRTTVPAGPPDAAALSGVLLTAFGVEAGRGPVARAPRPPRDGRAGYSRERVAALALAPVPGLPSLLQGDTAGFGLAMITVLPAAGLYFGSAGHGAQSAPEHVLLGVGGFYVATVLANRALGMRSLDRGRPSVGVLPADRGGATVHVAVPLR